MAGFIVVEIDHPDGRVTLVSKQAVRSADAIPLLNTVLKNAGYVAVQQGRILKIMKSDSAKRPTSRSPGSDPAKIDATDKLIAQVIPLHSSRPSSSSRTSSRW